MRDIKRIKPFLEKVEELWRLYPDYRFGQLIYVMAESMKVLDIFYPEESEWETAIQSNIDEAQAWIKKQKLNSKF